MDRTRARIVGNDRRIWRAWMGAAVLVWASSGLVGTLHAATIIVTTTQDGPVGSVAGCSLREAVQAINNQTNGNGCTKTTLSQPYGTNDRIQFAAGVNNIALTLAANPLANFALSIQRPVDIRGRGTGVTIISGGGGDRTLIHNDSRLTLRSLSSGECGNRPQQRRERLGHRIGHTRQRSPTPRDRQSGTDDADPGPRDRQSGRRDSQWQRDARSITWRGR